MVRWAILLLLLLATGCATTRAPVSTLGGERLLGSRRGDVDVYFLGLGAHVEQDVFKNEALLARDRFRERFGTEGRELLLVNQREGESGYPAATLTNLKEALAALGKAMDDEDVLILYVTSHGKRRLIEMRTGPQTRRERLRPGALRHYLNRANIRNRIIFLSACFSGSFIDDLRNPDTVIFTAASHRRPSFGCKADRRLTFFGKAYLEEAWRDERTLSEVFDHALIFISRWEEEEGLRHSEPQRLEGDRMKTLLQRLEGNR
jgi:hypothetical protein